MSSRGAPDNVVPLFKPKEPETQGVWFCHCHARGSEFPIVKAGGQCAFCRHDFKAAVERIHTYIPPVLNDPKEDLARAAAHVAGAINELEPLRDRPQVLAMMQMLAQMRSGIQAMARKEADNDPSHA